MTQECVCLVSRVQFAGIQTYSPTFWKVPYDGKRPYPCFVALNRTAIVVTQHTSWLSDGALPWGMWSAVAVTYDGATLRFYRNGVTGNSCTVAASA